ncbi:PLAC8 family protein [Phytophthora cinnamomi]|uniref:PLAC8 family protein n=1 Tax=Phytophthora cinnamomi TaxID=4785 RepID=UPI0035594B04|nr:PLAC8 family protein [Phytophthora cinnamomi]
MPFKWTALKHELGITVGKWDVGLCGCCTHHMMPNCLMAFCCPCVSLAQISSRLSMLTYDIALVLFVLLFCCTCGAVSIVGVVWLWQTRAQTRDRFQIPGSCCGDFCAACCCGCCCSMAQIATQIKSYKPGSCDPKHAATARARLEPPRQRYDPFFWCCTALECAAQAAIVFKNGLPAKQSNPMRLQDCP